MKLTETKIINQDEILESKKIKTKLSKIHYMSCNEIRLCNFRCRYDLFLHGFEYEIDDRMTFISYFFFMNNRSEEIVVINQYI